MTLRRRRHLGRAINAMGTALLSLVVAGLVICLLGALLGYRGVAIKSGSMTPTIGVGSLVISRSVSPLELRPHQIVTFRDPALHQQLVTHRVLSVKRAGNRVDFVTKGDANLVTEHWNVPVSGTLGQEQFVIPMVGKWLAQVNSKVARVVEIAFISLLLCCLAVHWIWREPASEARLSIS
jgi:signal peptidase I